MDTATARPTIFVGYSHHDEAWKDRLVPLFLMFAREDELEIWDDRRISTGTDRLPEIEATLARAHIAVLLISVNFLTSKLASRTEIQELLRHRQADGLKVIPVLVHSCSWESIPWLAGTEIRPKDGHPLAEKTPTQIARDLWPLVIEVCVLFFSEYRVPDLASRLDQMAQSLLGTRHEAESEPFLRHALALDEAALGPEHPDLVIRLHHLATALDLLYRKGEAEQLRRRALAIDETAYGKDHPNVARDLNQLILSLQLANRPEEAEPLMRRALAIDEAAFGPEHPTVATNLNNLAAFLLDMNRLEEAEPLFRRALGILEKSLGPDHPDTQSAQWNLWDLEEKMNPEEDEEPT